MLREFWATLDAPDKAILIVGPLALILTAVLRLTHHI